MAKLKVYAVMDNKVMAYEKPFFMRSRGEALRSWEEVVNDEKTQFCRHPNDFALLELAEYDEETGVFTNNSTPVNLGLAVQFKREPQTTMPLFEKKTQQTAS